MRERGRVFASFVIRVVMIKKKDKKKDAFAVSFCRENTILLRVEN